MAYEWIFIVQVFSPIFRASPLHRCDGYYLAFTSYMQRYRFFGTLWHVKEISLEYLWYILIFMKVLQANTSILTVTYKFDIFLSTYIWPASTFFRPRSDFKKNLKIRMKVTTAMGQVEKKNIYYSPYILTKIRVLGSRLFRPPPLYIQEHVYVRN